MVKNGFLFNSQIVFSFVFRKFKNYTEKCRRNIFPNFTSNTVISLYKYHTVQSVQVCRWKEMIQNIIITLHIVSTFFRRGWSGLLAIEKCPKKQLTLL